MKIFITGASGFLGSTLCKKLRAEGHDVTAVGSREADLRDGKSLDHYKGNYDQIYHLAAWTQAGDFCLRHPGEQWINNQLINTTVLNWWHRHQSDSKLITIGTSCAYAPDGDLKEEEYLCNQPIESLFTYAYTKRMLYVGQLALQRQFAMKWFTPVPSTLYGPGYHTDGRQMHFIFDLMRKILRGKIYGEQVVLWGDGTQRRELVHVEDFVDVMTYAAPRMDCEILNIGAGEELSIREFAHLICECVGYDPADIKYDTTRYVGARSKCLNIEKLRSLVPGYAPRPIERGISETVEWLRAHI